MKKRYFLTIEWCSNKKRGVFCSADGLSFSSEKQHTQEEMAEILGHFEIVLSPKSELFSQSELKEFNQYKPLAEYSNQYGIAIKKGDLL